MFNPERILTSMLTGRRGMGGKAALGLGLLGVAMEAIEHFSTQGPAGQPAPPSPSPGAPAAGPPPPPGALPPGRPPQTTSTPPPPPPVGPAKATAADAILLIRSMVAAAQADGILDERERARIMERLDSAGLDEEERRFVLAELENPLDLEALVGAVSSPLQAQQVYAVSLLAIEVDTDAERRYLQHLAERLCLSESEVTRLHTDLGRDTLP